jgi:hypothetical protein
MLAGDDHAWALAPFVRRLCLDSSVEPFVVLQRDGATITSWATSGKLGAAVDNARPDLVLLSLPSAAAVEAHVSMLAAQARRHGGTFVWIRSPDRGKLARPFRLQLDAAKVPSFHSEALDIHRGADGQPSARGYAGWAGALWRWIG